MSSKAQIKANQQNAQKSTGPRTAQGKAAVSQNAVRHGLFASEPVVLGEKQAEFDLHRELLLADWYPQGYMETILAHRIISLSWRLRRAERMQTQAIEIKYKRDMLSRLPISIQPQYAGQSAHDMAVGAGSSAMANIAIKDFSNSKVLSQMMLYERRIENSMYRTMDKLKKLQTARKIEDAAAEKQDRARRKRARAAVGLPARECNLWSENEKEVKKQSQFAMAREGLKSFAEGGYEDNARPEPAENKASQSQLKAAQRREAGQKAKGKGQKFKG